MKNIFQGLVVVFCFLTCAYFHGKSEYKKGYYNSCKETYTDLYAGLGLHKIDENSLENFCMKKARSHK